MSRKKKAEWAKHKNAVIKIIRVSESRQQAVDACQYLLGTPVTYESMARAYFRFRNADDSLPPIDLALGADLDPVDETEEEDPTTLAQSEIDSNRLRRKLREATKVKKKLVNELEQAQNRFELALAIQDYDSSRIIHVKPKKLSKKKRNAVAVALASDWHVEEMVDPKTVNGRNEYNPQIAEKRAAKYFESIIWLLNHNRASFSIDTLVFALMGDLITGYIHEELMETNAMSPTEAILFAQQLIITGIDFLLKEGGLKKITVPCVYGNHGRTTAKRRIQSGAANSFEWLMYHSLKRHYAKEKRVEFIIADGAHLYLDVYGTTGRFHHGDDIRYWGGVSGLSLPVNKAITKWNEFKYADWTAIGHYHQLADFGHTVANGSLIGYNAFALSIKAGFEVPQQAFFLVDEKRGRMPADVIWVT